MKEEKAKEIFLQGERRGRTSERADELELRSGLGAAREPLALLDELPLVGDEPQSVRAVSRDAGFDQPTADDHARPSDPASAVDG